MNADTFRQYYEYHFTENRKLWHKAITALSDAQFTQEVAYSHGSVRDQLLHLMETDDAWFSDLLGTRGPELAEDADPADREAMRAYGDAVEERVRGYLGELTDDMLFEQPLQGEDADLYLWQVLLHVVNHGTDHRAQILRLLNDLGLETESQDYIFYVYENG